MKPRVDIEPGELAQVYWFDAQGGGSWMPLADIPSEPADVVSVGCVVRNNTRALILAQSMDQTNGMFDSPVLIPWPNITKVMVISE
jgi:hypothetical protein